MDNTQELVHLVNDNGNSDDDINFNCDNYGNDDTKGNNDDYYDDVGEFWGKSDGLGYDVETFERDPNEEMDYEEIRMNDDEMSRRVEQALDDGLSSTQSQSYETLCKHHIQTFMSGAEQYAR